MKNLSIFVLLASTLCSCYYIVSDCAEEEIIENKLEKAHENDR